MGAISDTDVRADPVLVRFRQMLEATYGERLEQVILYGSRARGQAREDSDYDLAVFLSGTIDLGDELDRLADLSTELLHEREVIVHALPFRSGYVSQRTPLMFEVRREGVVL